MAHAELRPHPAIVAPGRSIRARLGLDGASLGLLLLTALLYFAITYPLLLAGRSLERRYRTQGLLHAS